MPSQYKHLQSSERLIIETFLRLGISQAGIARALGRDPGTISREIRRCTVSFGLIAYVADFGQRFAARARQRAGLLRRKLGPDLASPAWLHVFSGLAAHQSPQEISGRLRSSCFFPGDHLSDPRYVSHQTIYCALYALPRSALRTELFSHLKHSRNGRRPRRRSSASTTIREMTPISMRPPDVAARLVPGHWEGDLIKGAGGRSAIGTLVERTSRYVMLVRLDGLSADHILAGFSRRLRSIPPEMRKSLTYDRGSEMARHKTLAKRLRMDIFFCDAYSPWQRPSNEHANGILREFLPKGLDLSQFTDKNLRDLEFVINNTPRKILGFRTAQEAFTLLNLDPASAVALQA